jgi:hypothetical protein
MAAITTAVVGAAIAVKGQRDAKKAQKNAANQQRNAAIESADLLAKAGRSAEADIIRQNAMARSTLESGSDDTMDQLRPFANTDAFKKATDDFLSNLPIDGAIASSIRDATVGFAMSRPEFSSMIGDSPVGREIERQGDLSVSASTPQFNDSRAQNAQAGLAGAVDLAQIKNRKFTRLSDLAGSEAAQRANVLTGSAPALANLSNLSNQAGDARLLSSVASQNFKTGATEQIAGLAGNLAQQFRKDQFGFRPNEDPFDERNFS